MPGGINYVSAELLKRSNVITPNIAEAEVLTGLTIKDVADMETAARKLVEMGAQAVIVKGGHMEKVIDVLFDGKRDAPPGRRPGEGRKTRTGRGCTFRVGDYGAAGGGPITAGSNDAGKGLRDEGDLKRHTPVGKGRLPLDHFYRMKIEPLARGNA